MSSRTCPRMVPRSTMPFALLLEHQCGVGESRARFLRAEDLIETGLPHCLRALLLLAGLVPGLFEVGLQRHPEVDDRLIQAVCFVAVRGKTDQLTGPG